MAKKRDILVGAHISIAGGMYKSAQRALDVGATTMQIFTKSNKSWSAKDIEPEAAEKFCTAVKEAGLSKIMAHTSYLINLAAKNPEVRAKSIKALIIELERCELLNIPYLVLHPGAHVGQGVEVGIERIADGPDTVFKQVKGSSKILLENAAGQGTNIGSTLEELRAIYDGSSYKDRIGICIDTCHAYSAGFAIDTEGGYKAFWESFRKIIGIRLLKAIHLNDSKNGVGARLDRHEKLGKGKISLKTFSWLVNDEHLAGIPKVLETPIDKDYMEYAAEIALLRGMIK